MSGLFEYFTNPVFLVLLVRGLFGAVHRQYHVYRHHTGALNAFRANSGFCAWWFPFFAGPARGNWWPFFIWVATLVAYAVYRKTAGASEDVINVTFVLSGLVQSLVCCYARGSDIARYAEKGGSCASPRRP